jgi:hypothetical protein
MSDFRNLSGPDFIRMGRRDIKALSLIDLQGLVLRSQRLLAVVLCKPVQFLFEVMPDEYVLEVLLEWLTIEDQARLDRALTNRKYRKLYLSLLQDTEHGGVLSVSGRVKAHYFTSGVAEWLESRKVFMKALNFVNSKGDLPVNFLARIGSQLMELNLSYCVNITNAPLEKLTKNCTRLEVLNLYEVMVVAFEFVCNSTLHGVPLAQFCTLQCILLL